MATRTDIPDVLYVTRGLVEALLRLASESEPESVTVPLSVTPAGDLPEADVPDDVPEDAPVFTHFYLPRDGDSVTAVFGVDLGTPAGQTPGVFVSHPLGELAVSKRDDLREVVFVAVPPWDDDSVAAFDRRGRSQEFSILSVEPPEETPAWSD